MMELLSAQPVWAEIRNALPYVNFIVLGVILFVLRKSSGPSQHTRITNLEDAANRAKTRLSQLEGNQHSISAELTQTTNLFADQLREVHGKASDALRREERVEGRLVYLEKHEMEELKDTLMRILASGCGHPNCPVQKEKNKDG